MHGRLDVLGCCQRGGCGDQVHRFTPRCFKRLGLVASAARGECFKKVNVSSVNTVTFNGFAGIIVVKQVGDHPDFDEVYHLPGVPSLLSYGEVCQRNREKEAAGDKKHRLSLNKDGEIVWRCHDRDFVLANNGSNLHMYTRAIAPRIASPANRNGAVGNQPT